MECARLSRSPVILWVASCLGAWAASVFGEPQHRPMAEMHGDCASFQMNLQKELRAMQTGKQHLMARPKRGDHSNRLAVLSPVEVSLLPSDHTALTVKPKRSGDYAGMVPFLVSKSGHYRLSAGSSVWLEVVAEGRPVEPLAFEMQSRCATLFKTVVYALEAGVPYWLELSAMTREVTMLLTEHEASR